MKVDGRLPEVDLKHVHIQHGAIRIDFPGHPEHWLEIEFTVAELEKLLAEVKELTLKRRTTVKGSLLQSQIHLDHLALSEIRCPTCNRRFIAKIPNKLFMCRCGLEWLRSYIASEGEVIGQPVVLESVNPIDGVEIWLHEEEG